MLTSGALVRLFRLTRMPSPPLFVEKDDRPPTNAIGALTVSVSRLTRMPPAALSLAETFVKSMAPTVPPVFRIRATPSPTVVRSDETFVSVTSPSVAAAPSIDTPRPPPNPTVGLLTTTFVMSTVEPVTPSRITFSPRVELSVIVS